MKASFQEQKWARSSQGTQPPVPPAYRGADLRSFALKKEEAAPALDPLVHELEQEKLKLVSRVENMDRAIEALSKALESAKAQEKALMEGLPNDLVEMTLLLAEKVVDQEVRSNPDIVLKSAETLLRETVRDRERKLFLNPEDISFLRAERAETFGKIESSEGLSLVSEPSLPRGGCRLETPTSVADGGVFKRLEFVWSQMKEGPR